jgi:tetratricopeptide (TPR) repeat protein
MYIILGEPRERQNFEGYAELVASELWFYEGDPSKGLPAFFYLLFFKRNDVGQFQLYHPVINGPQELVHGPSGLGGDPMKALQVLRNQSPELAQASLSFDTAEPADLRTGRASLATDIVMSRIYESPKRAIRPDYADAWLTYGKRVSAEYSFNFVPSRSLFATLVGPDDIPFVQYSVEIDPQNFSVETDEDQTKFYTTLDVSLEVRDQKGSLVVASDKEVYLELSRSQMEQVKTSPFAYQDDFPILPGKYNVSVILRNRVRKQYTVAEQDMEIKPIPPGKATLSDVILGFALENRTTGTAQEGEIRTFQIGRYRLHPAAGGMFALGETIHLFAQVVAASPDYRIRFALLDGETKLQERTTVLSDYQGGPVIERFGLTGMTGGRYTFSVELLDPLGTVVADKTAKVQVSPRSAMNRPWLRRSSFNTLAPGLLPLAVGDQLLAQGRYQEARVEFEKSVAASEGHRPMAVWRLALVLVHTGDPKRALELLVPMEEEYSQQYEVMAGLGFAYRLQGDCAKAVGYLERAMKLRPPDTALLNTLGDCYQGTGEPDKAAEVFERSLSLDPEQKVVKEQLAAIQSN